LRVFLVKCPEVKGFVYNVLIFEAVR